jgi:sialate O-acetylesterase
MTSPKASVALFFAIALVSACESLAEVKLHGLFTDDMVLQRDVSVPIWGWADDGEQITVQFRDKTARTVAKDGKWMVRLRNLKAGGPDQLQITGNNVITIKNVLVGEVWIASGQSNMEWPLRASFAPEVELPKAANPQLRLFTVPKLKADAPRDNVVGRWNPSSPSTSSNFSAVAYYFGRDLQKALGVPVGIIHTSWGGSPAEAWMSHAVLEANPRYATEILESYKDSLKRHQTDLAKFVEETESLRKEGKQQARKPPTPPYWKPAQLYNGMIANLIPFAIQGAIWYQGESNAGRAHQYRTLFADMIENWRRDWGQGDFPFLLVQLAPFRRIKDQPGESDWAELREAQTLTTRVLRKVGMAVITDVGDENDIHPKKKEPVGARLALAARRIAYGEKLVHSGPIYKSMKIRGNTAVIRFDHAQSGLESRDGELKGFAIAGEDRRFVWAKATIDGDKVIVSSPEVSKPVAVRFGWADYPVVNLWNKEGLPASPFRTDDFPMITAPKTLAAK